MQEACCGDTFASSDDVAVSLANMAIGSVDSLRGLETAQSIPPTWNDQPPLLTTGPRDGLEDVVLLKGIIRRGIPPALRCAIWLSNVVQAVHPHQSQKYWHEYRTLAKVRALDNAYDRLLQSVVASNDTSQDSEVTWQHLECSPYGRRNHADNNDTANVANNSIVTVLDGATEAGQLATKRVLIGLEHVLGMEYAPLIPILVQLLLTSMSESYAFAAVREMAHSASYYVPCSPREDAAWSRAFSDVLLKLHKSTGDYLEDRGVLDVGGLDPIFKDFFVGILPIECVLRILDIYTLEGCKVLFRFGVALLVLYKIESAEQLITISNADDWWETLKFWAHSDRFNFESLVRKAYGVHGRGIRRQLRFPRRSILTRIIKMEEERLLLQGGDDSDYGQAPPARPLGLCKAMLSSISEFVDVKEEIKTVLANSNQARLHLAEWVPVTMRLTNLDLLYSTNYHGRSLEMFYKHVQHAKHTLLLCEVFRDSGDGGGGDDNRTKESTIVGMYASQAWRASTKVYGDGECFLFRLEPEAKCWKWKPTPTEGQGSLLDSVDLEELDHNNNQTALLEQFMVSTRNYISMGGNPDGSCGLRLNEDFTRAESSPAVGFDNEPLHGTGQGSVFEVGVVEVYGLVRQIDGRAA